MKTPAISQCRSKISKASANPDVKIVAQAVADLNDQIEQLQAKVATIEEQVNRGHKPKA